MLVIILDVVICTRADASSCKHDHVSSCGNWHKQALVSKFEDPRALVCSTFFRAAASLATKPACAFFELICCWQQQTIDAWLWRPSRNPAMEPGTRTRLLQSRREEYGCSTLSAFFPQADGMRVYDWSFEDSPSTV